MLDSRAHVLVWTHATLDIRTLSERILHGTWARICPRLGFLERYHCHHANINHADPLRTKTAIVCGLLHSYSLTVAWLMINTRSTVAIKSSSAPRKSRCLNGTVLNVRKFL